MSFNYDQYKKELLQKFGTCKKCAQPTDECVDCHHYICLKCMRCLSCCDNLYFHGKMCKSHQKCLECGEKMVCHFKKICADCDHPFHSITPTVTVGSCGTPYDDYDLIFNLNYPENGAEKHKIKLIYGWRPNQWNDKNDENKKYYYNIGMNDKNTPKDLEIFRESISILKEVIEENKKTSKEMKILFHCFSGYSRSVALATAYLALKDGMSVDDALELVRTKRKYIGPNPEFIKIIKEEIESKL